jgi:hypothetical protein
MACVDVDADADDFQDSSLLRALWRGRVLHKSRKSGVRCVCFSFDLCRMMPDYRRHDASMVAGWRDEFRKLKSEFVGFGTYAQGELVSLDSSPIGKHGKSRITFLLKA